MGFFVERKLIYYRYNSQYIDSLTNVHWYYYDESKCEGRLFTAEEKKQFIDFTTNTPVNFPDPGEYRTVENEDEVLLPDCDFPFEFSHNGRPKNLILKRKPELPKVSEISKCMDIVLCTSSHEDSHSYNLKFSVIGQIA